MVRAGIGGHFYMEEKYDTYIEKQLIFTEKDQKYSITAEPARDFEFDGWYRWYAGGVLGDRISENATYEVGMSDYDLSIIAMFKIKPEKSNLKTDVYQLHHCTMKALYTSSSIALFILLKCTVYFIW